MTLRGRVALVTGAARGIGAGIAARLLADGAAVAALDLDAPPVPDGAPPERFLPVVADVTDRAGMQRAVDGVVERFGRLDVAVCNAGFLRYRPFLELDEETWDATIGVDLTGVFHTAQPAARVMARAGRGAVVVVTSISAELPSREQGHYAAAKAGAQMLAQAMAWELAPRGVRVNSVAPGWVDTRLTADYLAAPDLRSEVERTIPLGRVGQPDDVAAAVSYLASDAASYVTGVSLRVDGGLIIGQDKT